LYELKTFVHPKITEAHDEWTQQVALERMDLLDLAIWFIDDGSTIVRTDAKSSYRVILSVGPLQESELFPHVQRIFNYQIPTQSLGRVVKNNSKATERNKAWIIPKPIATQILAKARNIIPEALSYKTPLW
jgi:hypothetical protein